MLEVATGGGEVGGNCVVAGMLIIEWQKGYDSYAGAGHARGWTGRSLGQLLLLVCSMVVLFRDPCLGHGVLVFWYLWKKVLHIAYNLERLKVLPFV